MPTPKLTATTTDELKASIDRWLGDQNLGGGDTDEFALDVAMELQSRIGVNAYTNRMVAWLRKNWTGFIGAGLGNENADT